MAEERMTLVERLRNPAYVFENFGVGGNSYAISRLNEARTLFDLASAADEIERLQRLVGVGSLKDSSFNHSKPEE